MKGPWSELALEAGRCSRCRDCECAPRDALSGPASRRHPGQVPLFIDADVQEEAIALMLWARRLPAGRDYIYFKDAGPGQFSEGDAKLRFGWDQARWDEVHRLLHKQRLIRELSWGVWEVTELAEKTVLAPYAGQGLRDRLSTLAV